MRRVIRLLLPTVLVLALRTAAQACPMCNQSIAHEDQVPRAYMYSILFMLSMPALIFTGFGVGLYRLHRKQADGLENEPPQEF